MYSSYDSLILASASLLLVVEAAMLLWPSLREIQQPKGLRALVAQRVAHLRALCCPREENPFSRCVASKAGMLIEKNCSRVMTTLAHMSCLMLLLLMLDIIFNHFGREARFRRPHQIIIVAFALCMLLLLCVPALARGFRRRCLWYSFGHVLIISFVCTFPRGEHGDGRDTARRFLFFLRVLMALGCPNVAIGLCWNGLYAAVSLNVYGTSDTANPGQAILVEAGEAVGVVLLMHGTWRSIWMHATYEVQELAWKGEGSAMSSLLNLVCDVVVGLDAELRFEEDVPRFAAMLALPAFKRTKGMQLQDFMPFAEDQDNFVEQLQPQVATEGASLGPGALHVRMRDSMGTIISVEVFYVEFMALDGCKRFFVGIREFAEQPVLELKGFGTARGPRGGAPPRSTELGKGTCPTAERRALDARPAAAPLAEAAAVSDPEAWEQLPRSSASPRSSCSLSSSQGSTRSQAAFVLTPNIGKDLSVVMTMSRWWMQNEGSCCGFHMAVNDLLGVAERLIRSNCVAHFSHLGTIQCGHCGVLSEGRWGMACDVCGRKIARRALARAIATL